MRAGSEGSFLLESVEKGRLGRHSLVGLPLVSFDEAEDELAAGRPVVGYLGYDHVTLLEPSVELPAEGTELPVSRFVVAETLVRFDHVASVAEILSGDAAEISQRLTRDVEEPPPRDGHSGKTRRFPPVASTRRGSSRPRITFAQETRTRSSSPSGPSARRTSHPRPLPLASTHQPLAVPLPPRARRDRARRLLAGDAREARRPARKRESDRRYHRADQRTPSSCSPPRRTRRSTSCSSTWAERPVQGLPSRHRAGGPVPRAGALLARNAPGLRGGR